MIAPIQSNLSNLPVGNTGVIADIDGDSPVVRRLLEMGLTSGTSIRVVRETPFGDPIQVQVRGYHLTLRRAEADHVRIAAL